MAAFYKTVSEGNFAVLFKFDGEFYAVVATVDVLLNSDTNFLSSNKAKVSSTSVNHTDDCC